ncbi:Hypothetical Protein FCC1311_014852 [Hondaea fermentalgiana]|uniref:Uncharacterized protein n=1 Tax=Hondaea fermentalgiana TaxID=2315210 RepID=A0A2R5G664_9STRA|nr:Hypothetical Protein FCC1311_014852 [Hondaea fermentalgiana]|eukprot:GBG25268.1 Hypothetical Protein FCC1311_014852 [Hondaea fermentalgiana]
MSALVVALVVAAGVRPGDAQATLASDDETQVITECSDAAMNGAKEANLEELTEDNFEAFLDKAVVTNVLFYEKDNEVFRAAEREFRNAAGLLFGNPNISVAVMHISSNPRVARAVAATGPVSVKLFDRRLRSENYFDLYALHQNGPKFGITSSVLHGLSHEYLQNSTGHDPLDRLSQAFATEVLERRGTEAENLLTEARTLAEEFPNGAEYVNAMESVLEQGLYVIAKAFNDVSLQLGNAAQPHASGSRLSLEQRARALLFMHISSELSKPLLGGSENVPLYRRKVHASNAVSSGTLDTSAQGAREARQAAAARAAALAGGSSLE